MTSSALPAIAAWEDARARLIGDWPTELAHRRKLQASSSRTPRSEHRSRGGADAEILRKFVLSVARGVHAVEFVPAIHEGESVDNLCWWKKILEAMGAILFRWNTQLTHPTVATGQNTQTRFIDHSPAVAGNSLSLLFIVLLPKRRIGRDAGINGEAVLDGVDYVCPIRVLQIDIMRVEMDVFPRSPSTTST